MIASNSEQIGTGMSSEAIGVSVAPSFFQSCVSDGKTARMEDVLRYKVMTKYKKRFCNVFMIKINVRVRFFYCFVHTKTEVKL